VRALVLHPDRRQSRGPRSPEARLAEAVGLTEAIDLEVSGAAVLRLDRPVPGTFFGSGQVERLAGAVEQDGIGLVVVDGALSPVQRRNLERALKAKVIDRTGLILEIFGARARTREGQLQVERAALAYVLEGLAAARAVGFDEIKLNCVVLRGENDDEVERLMLWAWRHGLVPRFIEVMPIAEGAKIAAERLVPAAELVEHLALHLTPGVAERDPDRGPAKYLTSRHDPELRVGFITGTTDTFCDSCDRLRVSANGKLRPCLATDTGIAAADVARTGTAADVARRVAEAWALKPDGRAWKGCTEPTAKDVSMRAIGG
jgi:cyclic pyranopterin phosphate synthase